MHLLSLNGTLILKEMKPCCIFKICHYNLEMKKMIVICLWSSVQYLALKFRRKKIIEYVDLTYVFIFG